MQFFSVFLDYKIVLNTNLDDASLRFGQNSMGG